MILKILVENNTLIDQYYWGEPAVSFYIEDGDRKILFDTGYSNIVINNAEKMKISLQDVDTIIFSHGHNDHTAGFQFMAENFDTSKMEIIAHPLCFQPKVDGNEEIGAPYQIDSMKALCQLKLTRKPYQVSEHIIFLGEIPRKNDFEIKTAIGQYEQNGQWVDDYNMDDSAIVYQDKDGIFIITGCSHSGICNIIEYAKEVCREERIRGVIGGFHLFDQNERLEKTISYMKENKIANIYPCHCVSFQAKARMNEELKVNEVGVGMQIMLSKEAWYNPRKIALK